MAIQAAFCPLSLVPLFDLNACPIRAGRIYFYDAETTNPRTVYKDPALTTAHTFPVLTDAYGKIPPIWVGLGSYKVVLKDNVDALLNIVDDLPGGVNVAASSAAAILVSTGMVIFAHGDGIYDGWLPLNAKTIGNANSSGTSRANDDTQALFTFLWNKDETLTVTGGRGISASADWDAAKTIALPDYRGRGLRGVDSMGANPANVLTAATTATPNVIGTPVGAETVTLTGAQLPAVTPTITINNAGSHTHTGSTDQQGNHNHGGQTGYAGDHTHTLPTQSNINSTSEGGGSGGPKNSGGYNATTGTAGGHTNSISIDGQHAHGVTTTAAGDHTHTATSSAIGSGGAHPNIPPDVLGYFHIKL